MNISTTKLHRFLSIVLTGVSLSVPAWAGGTVTLGCGNSGQQDFLIGTGRQFRGQGLELWPMVCLSTGQLSSYARVMDAGRFNALRTLASQSAKDGEKIIEWQLAGDLPPGVISPETFGQIGELTFGDVRSTVENAAQPTEEKIMLSQFTYWTHPTCPGRLVPYDYYTDTKAPCPACNNESLRVIPGNRPEWD